MRRWHLGAVHAIESSVYRRPWSTRMFASELAQRDSRVYLVALRGRRVLGYSGMVLVDDEAHITTVVVAPQFRRQGIGTALVASLLRAARKRGMEAASLEVRVGNNAAQALYRRFGFAPVGVRPRYYEDTNEDALIMWLHGVQSEEFASSFEAVSGSTRGLRVRGWTARR
ncbi:MAG: ribosomal protein S18-alanine N-acetyltransferase [Actinomycetota bacterium]|nr:ribosomal protein S18-alanine N-acetyltransferase [Actinomycetota bacterium]